MRHLAVAFTVIGALVILAVPAGAYTCVDSSCTLDLVFDEPTTYVGGQPLTDLKDHVFTYQRVGGPAQTMTIPASRPQGGTRITVKTAAQVIPPCTVATFTGALVSRTASGLLSTPVQSPTPTIDRTKLLTGAPDPACATPAPATGVTFQ
jgi:hypothetical protein